MSVPERRALVEPAGADVSVRRQCALLDLSRSGGTGGGPSGVDAAHRRAAS